MSELPPGAYRARLAYQDPEVGETYEADRFTSLTGHYRLWREKRAVEKVLRALPSGSRVLDCPCGTGRWWPALAQRGATIVGADLSPAMLDHARIRARHSGQAIALHEADAEALPFADASFDAVFSYALTKHLPRLAQYRVLAEFGRVARSTVLCSVPVFSLGSYPVWRRRYGKWQRTGMAESILLLPEELEAMGAMAGLRVAERHRCTTPLGTEWMVRFEK
jgi:ubiquinone/menaquinone biosynthesis C-methylase UbiE